jgi:hypothetical protein
MTRTRNMNAKLTRTSILSAPGTSLIQAIYSSQRRQNVAFSYLLGNLQTQKRLVNYLKYGYNNGYNTGFYN